jgi:hypothetical protein
MATAHTSPSVADIPCELYDAASAACSWALHPVTTSRTPATHQWWAFLECLEPPMTAIADTMPALVQDAMVSLPAESVAKCDPPLPKVTDWPALPATALFGLAGDIVRTIEPHSEADPAAILIQILTAGGNLIGPGLHCTVESTHHALTLCPVLVGETSKSRKGTSWGHIKRLCESIDPKWAAERITDGLSSAEGLINEVKDDPGIDRRLLVIQPEYASVLRIMAREGNALSPLLRSAWDSGDLRTLVKQAL